MFVEAAVSAVSWPVAAAARGLEGHQGGALDELVSQKQAMMKGQDLRLVSGGRENPPLYVMYEGESLPSFLNQAHIEVSREDASMRVCEDAF